MTLQVTDSSDARIDYDIRFASEFEAQVRNATRLLRLARNGASKKVGGAEARVHLAGALVQEFNDFVENLKVLLANPRLGALPPVTSRGVPKGGAKHFTSNGWQITIILDVPKKLAHFVALEPLDDVRARLNLLTGGAVGE